MPSFFPRKLGQTSELCDAVSNLLDAHGDLAVVGSRNFPSMHLIDEFLDSLLPGRQDVTIVSGGARGVDSVAVLAAQRNDAPIMEYLPDWDKHGKSAGFIRNQLIVDSAQVLVAFWDLASRGTRDSILRAARCPIPTFVVTPNGQWEDIARGTRKIAED